jgi:hypothetical protein
VEIPQNSSCGYSTGLTCDHLIRNNYVKPYCNIRVLFQDIVFQIQLWGHPERALLLTTPLEPSKCHLDSIPPYFIEAFINSLVQEFCLDYCELVWLFLDLSEDCKFKDSYVQIKLRWNGIKFAHHLRCQIPVEEMEHFINQGEWLGESVSFLQ